jgi:hypothetical protein
MAVHRRLNAVNDREAYSGATADVFEVGGKAYKLFRVRGATRTPHEVQVLFESECCAYARAAENPHLTRHVATFNGLCQVEEVINIQGDSVKGEYQLDCCYILELLAGCEAKLYADGLRDRYEYLRDAQNAFRSCGIDASDSSVFNYQDRERFKFIDFRVDHGWKS